MPQNNHDHFTFSYRADCKTCMEYVGPKRPLRSEAENDAEQHKKVSGNEDHIVKTQVTQTYHIA